MNDENELIPQLTIKGRIEARNRMLANLAEIARLRADIQQIAELNADYYGPICDRTHERHYDSAACRQVVDFAFWWALIESGGLCNSLTSTARNELYKKFEQLAPEFTEAEIIGYAQNFATLYGNNIEQTVKEVFANFINCRYNGSGMVRNKRDNCQKLEMQFRISQTSLQWEVYGGWHFNTWNCHRNLEDLYTACLLLDSKPRADYAHTLSAKWDEQGRSDTVSCEYFKVQSYKNGNTKITWEQEKTHILALINSIGSGGGLPEPLRKKYKPEHFEQNEVT